MARPLRIEYAGALYHVMARGNAREKIFRNDADRQAFCSMLDRTCERFEWRLWAYCMMGNHYHLLIETLRPTLSRGMREVNGVYTQAFNRRHRRVGHLLQGRYKAVLVDKDSYVLELMRYIVLNPVRAKLCATAADWRWSSYLAVMGKTPALKASAVDDALAMFAEDRRVARRAWARFVADGVGQEPPEVTHQLYVGDEKFVARTAKRAGKASSEIPRRLRVTKSLAEFAREGPTRNAAIAAAWDSGTYTLKDIGEYFSLHYASVSRIARG